MRRQSTDTDWEGLKDRVEDLYVRQGMTRDQVLEELAKLGVKVKSVRYRFSTVRQLVTELGLVFAS